MGALGTNRFKVMLISDSNFSSHFLEHAARLYNEEPKNLLQLLQHPKVKKYLFSKSLAPSLLN